MADLRDRILALPDDEASAILRRFAGATASGSPSAQNARQQVQTIATMFSIPAEFADPMSSGDLARTALLMLASDIRFEHLIVTWLDSPRRTLSRDNGPIDYSVILQVLQTQLPQFGNSSATGARKQPGLLRVLARQLLGMTGLPQSRLRADAEYKVWYATSRKPVDAGDPSQGFGSERDTSIHYGSCEVFVPRSHQIGSTGSGWWRRLVTRTDDRLQLLCVDRLEHDVFWRQVQQQLADSAPDDRDAVVFIHGYNVDFEQAALRTAQIGFDLQIRGAMAFYSWASRGDWTRYLADEAAVELDETPIAEFLGAMAQNCRARRVHVIVHSMGNRAVLRAVHQIAQQAQHRSGVRFGQIILAAPDVDTRKFLELCGAYRQLSEQTTLYVSERDVAAEASRWLHDFPRAGLMPPVTIAPGIHTVNAVNADITLLGHGYVAECRDVISDIHAAIRHGAAPRERFGLREKATLNGEPYWIIGA
jgi:esterase/lipase superfamily enzyme